MADALEANEEKSKDVSLETSHIAEVAPTRGATIFVLNPSPVGARCQLFKAPGESKGDYDDERCYDQLLAYSQYKDPSRELNFRVLLSSTDILARPLHYQRRMFASQEHLYQFLRFDDRYADITALYFSMGIIDFYGTRELPNEEKSPYYISDPKKLLSWCLDKDYFKHDGEEISILDDLQYGDDPTEGIVGASMDDQLANKWRRINKEKSRIMLIAIGKKFRDPVLRGMLLATNNAVLLAVPYCRKVPRGAVPLGTSAVKLSDLMHWREDTQIEEDKNSVDYPSFRNLYYPDDEEIVQEYEDNFVYDSFDNK
jgi:hypothetical protein